MKKRPRYFGARTPPEEIVFSSSIVTGGSGTQRGWGLFCPRSTRVKAKKLTEKLLKKFSNGISNKFPIVTVSFLGAVPN